MPTLKHLQTKFLEHLNSDTNSAKIDDTSTKSPAALFKELWKSQSCVTIPDGNANINRKGSTESEAFRNAGNRLYRTKRFDKALLAYNYALLAAPHPNEPFSEDDNIYNKFVNVVFRSKYSDEEYPQLAFAYANRSALLLEMEQYELATFDIHNALLYGYTKSKKDKIFERKVKCLIGLHKFDEAKSLSESILENVNINEIDAKEVSQLKLNLAKLISKCELQSSSNPNQQVALKNSLNNKTYPNKFSKLFFTREEGSTLKVKDPRNNSEEVSSALAVHHTPQKGRHLVATRDIEPGEVLVVEESQASFVLHNSTLRSHCSHCLVRVTVPLPCPRCSLVVFCSSTCRKRALDTTGGHRLECEVLPVMVALQPDLDVALAFRVVAQTGILQLKQNIQLLTTKGIINSLEDNNMEKARDSVGEIVDNVNKLKTKGIIANKKGNKSEKTKQKLMLDINKLQYLLDETKDGYEFLYTLEGNYDQRTMDEKKEAGISAVILTKLLLLCPKFWNQEYNLFDVSQVQQEDIELLGDQITRLILNIQCNAHCVKELKLTAGKPLNSNQYNNIGYAVFNKLSLLNHSCTANCHQSSRGDCKVLYSVSSIARGEEVTMSYGERFVSHSKVERQKNIRHSYYFTCDCRACAQDWPVFENLALKFMLRCCKCAAPVDPATYKCKSCHLFHKNTKKGNKKDKKSHQQQKVPQNVYDAPTCQSDIIKAWVGFNQAYENIEKYHADSEDRNRIEKLLSVMDKYAHLPNKPYIEAQEAFIRWFDLNSAASFTED